MDNIEELLRALANDSGEENSGQSGEQNSGDGLFSGLDPEMLLKMLSVFESMGRHDDNERFLLALKPLLREENRGKIDAAIRLLKLLSLLPLLKETGLMETLL